jgi:hypothetical protein
MIAALHSPVNIMMTERSG